MHWSYDFLVVSCVIYLLHAISFMEYVATSYTRRNEVEGGYTGFTLSVRLFVCLSVRLSAVSVRMITWILFTGFQFLFGICITWVKIFDGIEYEHRTSSNMRIMAGHVTFWQPWSKFSS